MGAGQHAADDVSHSTYFQWLSLKLIGLHLTPEGLGNITNTTISPEY